MNKRIHSFIVLGHKESKYLEECIKSLKKQNTKSEIYIATSTPNDFMKNITNKYSIKIIINNLRKEPINDFSFAYKQAKSKYVTLAHQDDIYLPNYTRKFLEIAENNPDNLITFCDYNELYNNNIRKNNLTLLFKRLILNLFFISTNSIGSKFGKTNLLRFGNPVCSPSVMFNKKNIGKFKSDKVMNILPGDWGRLLRLAGCKGSFVYLKDRLLIRRIHKSSVTSNMMIDGRRKKTDWIIFQKLWPKPIAKIISKIYSISYLSNK